VISRRDVLFSNVKGPNYARQIKDAWADVAAECVELGFPRFAEESMDMKKMKDDLWAKKRSYVKAKYDAGLRTGFEKTVFIAVTY
jgi:hypothetical protein